ncbi:MAG TPA: hypothetical protein VJ063_14035 [Verrucomicrobiae bacterium]|nr:hypothetical protein [Verrucomicrobiae bacterium]
MKVIVQQLDRKQFLSESGQWTAVLSEAAEFKTVLEAIVFCIQLQARAVKLRSENNAREEVYFYPFGGDPALKLEHRKLRKGIREARRLRAERRQIRARIDALMAPGKEKRKQVPFPAEPIAADFRHSDRGRGESGGP